MSRYVVERTMKFFTFNTFTDAAGEFIKKSVNFRLVKKNLVVFFNFFVKSIHTVTF